MNSYVCGEVDRLLKKYGTRNPFEIIDALGIELIFDDSFQKLNGFYTYMNRQAYIVINDNISQSRKQIVAAHELGHDRLHRHLTEKSVFLREFELYNMASRHEYEANCFASDLLISDEEIEEFAVYGYDMQQIAQALDTDINLIGLKLENMNMRGYNFNIGIEPESRFLSK